MRCQGLVLNVGIIGHLRCPWWKNHSFTPRLTPGYGLWPSAVARGRPLVAGLPSQRCSAAYRLPSGTVTSKRCFVAYRLPSGTVTSKRYFVAYRLPSGMVTTKRCFVAYRLPYGTVTPLRSCYITILHSCYFYIAFTEFYRTAIIIYLKLIFCYF